MTDTKRCPRCWSPDPTILVCYRALGDEWPGVCSAEDHDPFHDPPKASEPTPDEDTASQLKAELAEKDRHIDILANKVEYGACGCGLDNPDDVCLVHAQLIEDAKREQMEADCRAVETFPVLAASLRDELVAAIRAVLDGGRAGTWGRRRNTNPRKVGNDLD